jgi:hypothetical protein
MVTLLDGPAAGTTLLLKRSPIYLRVVINPRAKKAENRFDALDQLNDQARAHERIVVYRRIGPARSFHMKGSGGISGVYAMAEYQLHAEQPDDHVTRDTSAWRDWCWCQQRKGSLFPG